FDGHVPEDRLRHAYAWADVLVCPSIQDGFAVVLAHAQAAALPFVASSNTGGPDLLAAGGRGWIVPIRAPDEIARRLESCDADRQQLADAVRQLYERPLHRSWTDVGRDFMSHVRTSRSG
ncbi:MAG: glycosyltransferase, partial [Gemmatimonadota bacterium]